MSKLKKLLLTFFILISLSISFSLVESQNFNNDSQLLKVHFIDVDQGDAILIQINNKALLIDSGPKASNKKLISYLDKIHLKKIDYLISTHPHEDHIGNMSYIINNYSIKKFYAPKVSHTSNSFESMVEALISKNLKINVINNSTSVDLGYNISITFFPSNITTNTDNLNLYSPFIKLEYMNISFLFTGDAEIENERAVLNSDFNLKSTVLKIGHHGSSTSTSESFYDAVSPSVVVIPVGEDNKYNHPSYPTLNLLKKKNSLIYRTDLNGTIVLCSDGKKLFKQ